MFLKQYYLGCLSHASYMIADETSGKAVVVDPQRDIDQYIEDAQAKGFTITHVLLTHFHADFLAGHLELREHTRAHIVMGKAAEAEFDIKEMECGDHLELGPDVMIRVLETPGHTPESVCYVVYDRTAGGERPHAVMTGDTLFCGDVGRPDLMASAGISSEEMAGQLFDSLHGKLLKLPDETLVYPAHGAGSACGKNLSKESFSTIGQQRKFNYACKFSDREEFISVICSDQPDAPAYFKFNAELNKKHRQTLTQSMESVKALSLEHVLTMDKVQLLDCRGPNDFARGFLKGSLNVGLSGNFASWCGSILNTTDEIVIIAPPGKENEAAVRLGRIGFDHVAGYLEGGAATFLSRPELVDKISRLNAREAADQIKAVSPVVLDVRTQCEWDDKHIDGSLCVPLNQLAGRIAEVPRDQRLLIHCLGGYRSMIAASILAANGFAGLTDVIGGINGWVEAGLPTVAAGAVATGSGA